MTPLVLIPGFMCDARLFEPQIAALAREVTVPIPTRPSLAEMAAGVLAAAPARFALGGLSMGGIVALEIVAQAPERVERLALMDTTPRADAPENHAIRTRQIADVKAGRLATVMRDELKPAYLADGPGTAAILDLCMAMAQTLGPQVFEAQALALRDRPDHRATLPRIAVPTLVLSGAQDRLCPPARHAQMAAAIPGARRVTVPGAGHLPTLERPRAVTEALADWLGW